MSLVYPLSILLFSYYSWHGQEIFPVTALAAAIYLVAVLLEKLISGIPVPGYATIIVLILLLGSMQLFCIGIIGEYVGKIFEQSKNRPIYLPKEYLTYEED